MNRDRLAAIIATIGVVAVLVLGLFALGGPGKQRLIQTDLRTLQALGNLSRDIQFAYAGAGKVLPTSLDHFARPMQLDTATYENFTYHPKADGKYELCARFVTDSRSYETQHVSETWTHPKGEYCFQLNASQPAPQVPTFY